MVLGGGTVTKWNLYAYRCFPSGLTVLGEVSLLTTIQQTTGAPSRPPTTTLPLPRPRPRSHPDRRKAAAAAACDPCPLPHFSPMDAQASTGQRQRSYAHAGVRQCSTFMHGIMNGETSPLNEKPRINGAGDPLPNGKEPGKPH